jgi:Holliday junction DNA helicase RuvA
MIRMINGTIEYFEDGGLVIRAGHIGYLVFVPLRLLEQCTAGQTVQLFTYHHVREDQLALYGFDDRVDLAFFKQLISVSGVGPKLGLQILSRFTADEVKRAIVHGDMTVLTSISGIGRKTAERIVVDLKESVNMLVGTESPAQGGSQTVQILEALLTLGYTKAEAMDVIRHVDQSQPLEEQLKSALRLMSQPRT